MKRFLDTCVATQCIPVQFFLKKRDFSKCTDFTVLNTVEAKAPVVIYCCMTQANSSKLTSSSNLSYEDPEGIAYISICDETFVDFPQIF